MSERVARVVYGSGWFDAGVSRPKARMVSLVNRSHCVSPSRLIHLEGFVVGLKRIQVLTNPSPNRVIETNTEYPRIPPDI